MNPHLALRVHGRAEPPARPVVLRAGPLSVEWWRGDLRYLRLGAHELIRRVYFALRDDRWGTVPLQVTDVTLRAGSDDFTIDFVARHDRSPHRMEWRASVLGLPSGEIRFAIEGLVLESFVANRVGFCLLHPAEAAGRACRVEHVDGSAQDAEFPEAIAPHQPFCDIKSIRHLAAPGVWCEASFEGDTFEMEDQRNWSDASFKTYCTPLHLSVGSRFRKGGSVRQSVTLRAGSEGAVASSDETVTIGEPGGVHPVARRGLVFRRGLGRDHDVLGRCGIGFVRVEVAAPEDLAILREAAGVAARASIPLEIAVHHAMAGRGSEIADAVIRSEVRGVTVLSDGAPTTDAEDFLVARSRLEPFFGVVRWGAGSSGNFTELNRRPPSPSRMDYVGYPVNAQVHAFENVDILETCLTHGAQVYSARRLYPGKAIAVGPISIGPTGDPRRGTLLEAAWTVASLARVSEAGAVTVCHDADLLDGGRPTPLAMAFEAIGNEPWWDAVTTSSPLRAVAFGVRGERPALWVVNLTPWELPVVVPGHRRQGGLDEEALEKGFATSGDEKEGAATLGPYTLARFVPRGSKEPPP
ncbi:MAG: hypothetical protein KIS66_11435 [Fimbriimonadaceae bacterium]|nr:hypothetical protein [Fimbriimonadaceae bacterium]